MVRYASNMFWKVMLLVVSTFVLSSCEETLEYYYGIPMQPKFFDNSDWQKVINVFGILRPDSASVPMSFIFMEKTYPTKNAVDEDMTLTNSIVKIYSTDVLGKKDTFNLFFYESTDTTKWSFPRYISYKLRPQPGCKYRLECKNDSLPTVTCEASVPYPPEIIANSLSVDDSKIVFTIKTDSLAYLYDIYLFSSNDMISKRFVHKENKPMEVNWQFERNGDWLNMVIYAYDKNMASYLSTATNSFYTFNTYRPPVTTVDGGFGVFGAMNLLSVELPR
jgi:hypothetical protein